MEPETQSCERSSPSTFNMPKGFNLFHHNVRSLFPKIDVIRLFANENPFHVLAFSETWLTSNISDSEISISGYSNPLRCDRNYGNNIEGGIAVYLKNSIPHKGSISSTNLEAIAIKVTPTNSPSFILAAVYRPNHQCPLDPCFNDFLNDIMDKSSDIDDLIVMGDLNLNQLEPDNMTRTMDDICTNFNLSQLIDVPTRITDNTSTLIDLLYVSNLSFILLLSNRNPIFHHLFYFHHLFCIHRIKTFLKFGY